MKIAQVTPVYPPKGGMGTVAKIYAEGMREMGEEVSVFTGMAIKEKGVVNPPLSFSWGNGSFMPSIIWKLRKFDLIHLHYPFYGTAIFTAFVAWIWRKPFVITYHMQAVAGGFLGWLFNMQRAVFEPWILQRADAMLISSFDYAQSIGLSTEKLIEMPFGIDISSSLPKSQGKRLGMIFVGGLDRAHYFKGVPILLRALSQVEGQNWELNIIGGGEMKSEYELLCEELNLSDKVSFLGRISDKDLRQEYQKADIHFLPSINQGEAFGIVSIEAAAFGLISIISDLPGVRTVIQDKETGFLVQPGDIDDLAKKIQFCLEQPQKVSEMGRAARKRVETRYNNKILLKKLHELYKGLRLNI